MTSEFAIAVHALVFLDRSNATIASEELADNVCTNPVCIRRVMGKLKKSRSDRDKRRHGRRLPDRKSKFGYYAEADQ